MSGWGGQGDTLRPGTLGTAPPHNLAPPSRQDVSPRVDAARRAASPRGAPQLAHLAQQLEVAEKTISELLHKRDPYAGQTGLSGTSGALSSGFGASGLGSHSPGRPLPLSGASGLGTSGLGSLSPGHSRGVGGISPRSGGPTYDSSLLGRGGLSPSGYGAPLPGSTSMGASSLGYSGLGTSSPQQQAAGARAAAASLAASTGRSTTPRKSAATQLFEALDHDQNGQLDLDEVRRGMRLGLVQSGQDGFQG